MHRAARLVTHGLPAAIEGVGLQDGAVAAAVGVVVHLVLLVGGVVPDLPCFDGDEPLGLGATQDALVHHGAHGVGEEGQNVNAHRIPSPQ